LGCPNARTLSPLEGHVQPSLLFFFANDGLFQGHKRSGPTRNSRARLFGGEKRGKPFVKQEFIPVIPGKKRGNLCGSGKQAGLGV